MQRWCVYMNIANPPGFLFWLSSPVILGRLWWCLHMLVFLLGVIGTLFLLLYSKFILSDSSLIISNSSNRAKSSSACGLRALSLSLPLTTHILQVGPTFLAPHPPLCIPKLRIKTSPQIFAYHK